MTKTLPFVVRCLSLYLVGGLLLPFNLMAAAVDVIPAFNTPSDTLQFSLQDCDDEITFCLDSLPLTDAVNLVVTVNGEPYSKNLVACSFDTINAYTYSSLFGQGNQGPYELVIWRVGDNVFSGTFNNIPDLVDSMNLWDPAGNWVLNEMFKVISGGSGGISYSDMAINVPNNNNSSSSIGHNLGIEARGLELSFGVGVHRVSILDTLNHTFRNAVIVISCSSSNTQKRRVLPDETGVHCLDFSHLLTDVEVSGFCGLLTQENVDFQIVNNDSCVSYTGVEIGFDTTCLVVCDALAFCDTTLLIVETYDVPHYREATINLEEGTTQNYCLDTTVLVGLLSQFVNSCPEKSGAISRIFLDPTAYCATIEGEIPGQDTSCLVLCNQFGRCDTTILYINVHPAPTTETIDLIVTIGDSLEICPETAELTGLVTGIDNFCEKNSSETIIFNINNVDLCFGITAENLGTDSICAVICDNFLICDTTYYIISVVSNAPSLTATPDLDSTSINSPVAINVLGNDTIPDGIMTEMEVISPSGEPTNGTATTNPEGTITYVPNQDFCDGTDEFQYRICNTAGCDTTSVSVYVSCAAPPSTGMKFYTGFSPNGDGRNDYFKIEGIAQYPNNELSVYNRWGITIFKQKGYKNAWDGTYNKKSLPDGTYFYVLKDGEGKSYSGYFYIRR